MIIETLKGLVLANRLRKIGTVIDLNIEKNVKIDNFKKDEDYKVIAETDLKKKSDKEIK